MDILQTIVQHKKKLVEENKSLYPVKLLEKSIFFSSPAVSLKKYITRSDKSGIIAEFKKKSPSKGFINKYANIEEISIGYMQNGASALSILTDTEFFGGNNDDLTKARKLNFCPILRKDFIIDEYQIFEARSIGADAILLIAAILNASELSQFHKIAKDLGMEVLIEIHEEAELDKLPATAELVGINNRDLKTFNVDIERSIRLCNQLPTGTTKIAESGIDSPQTGAYLLNHGFNGLLIGENFMKETNPAKACGEFIESLYSLRSLQPA